MTEHLVCDCGRVAVADGACESHQSPLIMSARQSEINRRGVAAVRAALADVAAKKAAAAPKAPASGPCHNDVGPEQSPGTDGANGGVATTQGATVRRAEIVAQRIAALGSSRIPGVTEPEPPPTEGIP